jgi:hypothetical protein
MRKRKKNFYLPNSEREVLISKHYKSNLNSELDENMEFYEYRINANWIDFVVLHKLDPYFFSSLYALHENELFLSFTLEEVHVCYDTTFPIMPYISSQMSTGRYKSYGHKPYGFGFLKNKPFKGQVGRQSNFFKNYRKEILKLNTLYVGNRSKNSTSVILYDKLNEQKIKKNDITLAQSRIEVRYNFVELKKENAIPSKEWKDIFLNYLTPKADCLLTKLFLKTLMENIIFLTKQRIIQNDYSNRFAPWWVFCVITPLQSFIDMFAFEENKKNYFYFKKVVQDSSVVETVNNKSLDGLKNKNLVNKKVIQINNPKDDFSKTKVATNFNKEIKKVINQTQNPYVDFIITILRRDLKGFISTACLVELIEKFFEENAIPIESKITAKKVVPTIMSLLEREFDVAISKHRQGGTRGIKGVRKMIDLNEEPNLFLKRSLELHPLAGIDPFNKIKIGKTLIEV